MSKFKCSDIVYVLLSDSVLTYTISSGEVVDISDQSKDKLDSEDDNWMYLVRIFRNSSYDDTLPSSPQWVGESHVFKTRDEAVNQMARIMREYKMTTHKVKQLSNSTTIRKNMIILGRSYSSDELEELPLTISDIESASNNFETVVVEVVCPQACSLYSGIGEIKNARITVVKCMVLNGFLIFCWIVPYNTLTQVMCFLLCH